MGFNAGNLTGGDSRMTVSLKDLPDALRGIAWPPSARTVRRPVKSGNERDPCPMLRRYLYGYRHSWGTARAKWEEGAGDGRSVWSESPGLHAGNNGRDNGMRPRKGKLILETRSQYRSTAATRRRDGGIPSSRRLASFGEYVPAPCTHRPSSHPSGVMVKPSP